MDAKNDKQPRATGPLRYLWHAIAGVLFIAMTVQFLEASIVDKVPYSTFIALLEDGKIADVRISDSTLQATLKEAAPSGHSVIEAQKVDPAVAQELGKYGISFAAVASGGWLKEILSWVAPPVLFAGIWLFMLRRVEAGHGMEGLGMDGLMNIGRSRAKVYVEREVKVTFGDVAGIDEAKKELQEVVAFLKDPASYSRLGARMPKGLLLVGPPGTGKTLLARAVAGEASVPFFSISGSEFVEMFVGVGAARVRDLFEQARKSAPCIIFIDELDALGRARGVGAVSGGIDEKEQTLNQLLVELDGFDSKSGIVLLSATNRPEILDPALLRAGRFDRQVVLDRPDKAGRAGILKIHTRGIALHPSVDLVKIAGLTVGFSGADLANLANEAALTATRRGAAKVEESDFIQAFERVVAGAEKKNLVMTEHERCVVANHEMGHAIVAMALPDIESVHKVSIIPRGVGALGYTLQRSTEEHHLLSRENLCDKLAMLLGGRAAEALKFGETSTGAGDDLTKATDIARAMVMQYGMDETLGNVVYEPQHAAFLDLKFDHGERAYSDETSREIDCAVRALVDGALARAKAIISANRQVLDESAGRLLTQETLNEEELEAIKARVICAHIPLEPVTIAPALPRH